MAATRRNPPRRHSFDKKRLLSAAAGLLILLAASTVEAYSITNCNTTCADTLTVGVPYSPGFQILTDLTGSKTYGAAPLPLGLTFTSTGLISGTPAAPGVFTITLTATSSSGSATPGTLTLTIVPEYRVTVAYDWSGQASTSYLGGATKFLGKTAWGQMFQPSVSGTLYFGNNRPAYGLLNNLQTYGVSSIDVLVQNARQLGAWSGTSVQVLCYADWSPEFPAGSTATLIATLYDPKGTTPPVTQTKTISPGSNYSPIPGTLVGTITYTRVSGTTASITLP